MAAVRLLPGPYEILELGDRESRTLEIVRFDRGDVVIHPRYPGAPAEKRIVGLRVWVPRAAKPLGPDWWDITSQTLIAQLDPILRLALPAVVRITKYGVAPRARFTVEHIPRA